MLSSRVYTHGKETMICRILVALLSFLLIQACSDSSDSSDQRPTQMSPASLTVVPIAAPEGAPGEMRSLVFRVTMTEPQASAVELSYWTSAGSATADEDYLEIAGELSIAAGEIESVVSVDMIGDAEEEAAETFTLNISTSDNALATATKITGTIANDDTACDTPFAKSPNPWLVNGADPLNFAHRGGVIDFPENTLYAYAEAALAGADVLEMDVYQTRDNQLVVLHDLSVDRTTNGGGDVANLTLAELALLDAAYWFVPGVGTPRDRPVEDYVFRGIATGDKPPPSGYSAADFRIPTLEQALARFPHNLINLELKPDLDGMGNYEQQMAVLLQRYGRYTDLIAGSFVDEATDNFKAVAPCVYSYLPLGLGLEIFALFLATGEIPDVPEHITAQVPPDASQIGDQIPGDDPIPIVSPELVAAAHNANTAVQVWTINTCEEMLRMIDIGVDGIMTDRPLLLESLLAQPAGERTCE